MLEANAAGREAPHEPWGLSCPLGGLVAPGAVPGGAARGAAFLSPKSASGGKLCLDSRRC